MSTWNPAAVKTQLRLTTQRLGQLQEKKDSQGQITRRDIATLLQQDNVVLARAKAQNLIQEDVLGDLLEVLEMHVGLILEHFSEIDKSITPSPVIVEAASSIIFASPHIYSRDLSIVRDILIQRLGPDFARSAISNHDGYVPLRVLQALSAPPPSAVQLNDHLTSIAVAYGVKWTPELGRQDILNSLSELLDAETSPTIDVTQLRKLCAQGIPDNPPWLRPRIWKIFFGILPVAKALWHSEIQSLRETYYNLIRRLLGPLSSLSPPTSPLESHDESLLNASKQLYRIPRSLFSGLQDEPDITTNICPLDDAAPDDIRIDCATHLDFRLRDIQEQDTNSLSSNETPNHTPEIRIESDHFETPEISLSTPEIPSSPRSNVPTTLLPSKAYNPTNAHQKHFSALLRLLYLHSCINPGSNSPHIPSLLVPLYSVLLQEIDPQDLAHAEADTFWLFEAIVGEFSELEDEEAGDLWMRKFGERLFWADEELAANLHAKGLDPALPHYSYRWLTPLLTQTLPLPSVLLVWDALFSRPMRDRESNPKIDYLLDICTGMLIRVRTTLFRLGMRGRRSPGLWDEDSNGIPASSPSRGWQQGDAFLEGMSLLQPYPIERAGGIDRILQTASDLCRRRDEEVKAQKGENLGLGARLKATMWRGFVNQMSTESSLEVEAEGKSSSDGNIIDDGNETETPQTLGITSRLATTVWRGITNQTAMEAPPSPPTPLSSLPVSPLTSPLPTPPPSAITGSEDGSPQSSPASLGPSSIWSYAEKLKDSDTVATLAKVSTNWRAKAMMGRWSMGGGSSMKVSVPILPSEPASNNPGNESRIEDGRRVSLPEGSTYSPPERPAFFRSPRDSMLPQAPGSFVSSPGSPEISSRSDNGFISKTQNIRASLVSSQSVLPSTKSVPRPLLLNSSSLITAPPSTLSSSSDPRSSRSNPASEGGQWAEVLRAKGRSMHKTSQSSLSSLSPSDALGRLPKQGNHSDRDSDYCAPSRVIPLNRMSVSPMAPGFRLPSRRPTSTSSSGTSPERGLPSPSTSSRHSPTNTNSSPLASHPVHITSFHEDKERQRSTVISVPIPLEPPTRKVPRKRIPPSLQSEADDTSDPPFAQAQKGARARRYPSNFTPRTREISRPGVLTEQKTASTNSLTPEDHQDQDIATTPKASTFDQSPNLSSRSPRRTRKHSGEDFENKIRKNPPDGNEVRLKKIMTDVPLRTRKMSSEGEDARSTRESAAIEGDDEGYDDLLSAYESEESTTISAV